MSFKLVAQVMDIKVGSPLRKMILIKLADQANDSGVCWPSYDSIAKTCEISKRSVITHIQKLEQQGFLHIEKRYNTEAGKNFSNKYHLTLSKGSANDSPVEGGANAALVQMSVEGSEGDALGSAGAAPEPTNEPTNEPINKDTTQNKNKVKFQPVKPDEVSEQVWIDLLATRKRKGAIESQTAWTRLHNSTDKAQKATGHSLEDIYSYWVMRAWAGFDHQWYINAHPQPTNNIQGATNAHNQPANSQHQQPKQSSSRKYDEQLAQELSERYPDEFPMFGYQGSDSEFI